MTCTWYFVEPFFHYFIHINIAFWLHHFFKKKIYFFLVQDEKLLDPVPPICMDLRWRVMRIPSLGILLAGAVGLLGSDLAVAGRPETTATEESIVAPDDADDDADADDAEALELLAASEHELAAVVGRSEFLGVSTLRWRLAAGVGSKVPVTP